MNEHGYFRWDMFTQPLQTPQFGMGPSFFDVNSILEQRKEKSRDAARSRRGKENYEFYELAKLLPLPAAITSQLDKASIIRLAISSLKLRDFTAQGDPQCSKDGFQGTSNFSQSQSRHNTLDPFESRQGTHILQSLDGFAFILGNDGRFLYISETVSIYLGLSQVEMTGSSIFDYVHNKDHAELIEQLGMSLTTVGPSRSPQGSCSDDTSSTATSRPISPPEKGYVMVHGQDKNTHKSFCLRMKSTLTKRGVNVKSSGYRVLHIMGSVRCQSSFGVTARQANSNDSNISFEPTSLGFVGMAIALPPPTITELRLEVDTFITRMSPDFKVIYCEPVISDLMDLSAEDVNNRLLYDLCHPADLQKLRGSHVDMLNKGQAFTEYYRLLNRKGGHVYVQTCATVMLNNKNSNDQNILAINFVVSSTECKNIAMDLWQVTGDVTSLMSSTSKSVCREEKLKELRSKNRIRSSRSSNDKSVSSSPSESPHDTHWQRDTESGSSNATYLYNEEDIDRSSLEAHMRDVDSKYKSRKIGNPRKRRISSGDTQDMSLTDNTLKLNRGDIKTSVIADSLITSPRDSHYVGTIMNYHCGRAPKRWSPNITASPEDLSFKGPVRQSPNRSIIQHSARDSVGSSSPDFSKRKTTSTLGNISAASSLPLTINTVQELEAAMNRHLSESTTQNESNIFISSLADGTNGFRGFPSSAESKHAFDRTPSSPPWRLSSQVSDKMATSAFPHSINISRESVIKTNSRFHVSLSNMEPPASTLTPPEPDPTAYRHHNTHYSQVKQDSLDQEDVFAKGSMFETPQREEYSFIPYKDHITASYFDHIPSSMYKDHMTSTYKDLTVFRDIPSIPAAILSQTGRTHQAYKPYHQHFSFPIETAVTDACSMTPPSPNSPDNIKHPADINQFDLTIYSTELNNTYNLSQKHAVTNSSLLSPTLPSTHHYQMSRYQSGYPHQDLRRNDPSRESYYGMSTPPSSSLYINSSNLNTRSKPYEVYTRPALPWY